MAVPPAAEPFSAHPLTFPASSRAALMALPRQAAETLNIYLLFNGEYPPFEQNSAVPREPTCCGAIGSFCGGLGWGQGVLKR